MKQPCEVKDCPNKGTIQILREGINTGYISWICQECKDKMWRKMESIGKN